MNRAPASALAFFLGSLSLVGCQGETPTGPAASPAQNLSAAVSYTLRDLGTLGGPRSGANGINGANHVVGSSYLRGDRVFHAFLWKNGVMQDLGTLGGANSEAVAINDLDQVVGWSMRRDGKQRPVLWARGRMRDLGSLGGSFAVATSINQAGQVVGNSTLKGDPPRDPDETDISHAFLWHNGTMIDLGTLGGASSGATDINDAGIVVGWSDTKAGRTHACLWRNGVIRDLGALDGNSSGAAAINRRNQIVGHSTVGSEGHAFLWQQGVLTDLGTLGGDTYSSAYDINAAGQVVGDIALPPAASRRRAFVLIDGRVIRLPYPGRNSGASAINARGFIVGATDLSSTRYHAALWRPN
jgi:probable HAF family extracellular repeat protein